jgi:hypothetical protein
MEDEEAGKGEATFNLVARKFVDLLGGSDVRYSGAGPTSRTAAVGKARICLNPRARTLLPRLVNHLYVSS